MTIGKDTDFQVFVGRIDSLGYRYLPLKGEQLQHRVVENQVQVDRIALYLGRLRFTSGSSAGKNHALRLRERH